MDIVSLNAEIVVKDVTSSGLDLSEGRSELAASIGAAQENEELKAVISEKKTRLVDRYSTWEVPPLQPDVVFNSRI